MRLITELVEINVAWMRQALDLIQRIDDAAFSTTPEGMAPHRAGSHLRHVLEFYECFLEGLEARRIDYDARRRDEAVATQRCAAGVKIDAIIRAIRTLREDGTVMVRMEDAAGDAWLASSVSRELQALSSHTIHHFALIAITLRLHGFDVDPDFGMSPSTLRYQAGNLELTSA